MIESHVISFTDDQVSEIMEATEKILRSGKVILGDKTREFEAAFANACGREYGVAVGSDTAAFEMQLKTLGGEDGTLNGAHVLYPALAFPSILESVRNAGGNPWFVDADLDGHLFASTAQVEQAINGCKTATGEYPVALILMHTGGLIARDSAEIANVCESYGVKVLEDAAHSFGARLDGRPAGSYGLSSAFSLYATKPMHACEGGVIVTDDEALAQECKIYRNYGRTSDFGRSVIKRHGYSWRLTEIQAAIGLSNLKAIKPNLSLRRKAMTYYDHLVRMSTMPEMGVSKLEMTEGMEPNGYRYILMLPEGWNATKRLAMKQTLVKEHGVDLPGEVYELPSHRQPIWQKEFGTLSMPAAENFCDRHFALPVYQTITPQQQEHVVDSVAKVIKEMQ